MEKKATGGPSMPSKEMTAPTAESEASVVRVRMDQLDSVAQGLFGRHEGGVLWRRPLQGRLLGWDRRSEGVEGSEDGSNPK